LLTFFRLCVAQSPQNWQTSVGLPFFQIEGTVRLAHDTNHPPAHTQSLSPALTPSPSCVQVVEWDEVRFDVRLMQRVPYGAQAPFVPSDNSPSVPTQPAESCPLRFQRA